MEVKVEPTKNVSAGTHWSHQSGLQSQDINGGHPKSAPKGKGVGSCEDEETETSQNVPLGAIDLGVFEVLSDHVDAVEDG